MSTLIIIGLALAWNGYQYYQARREAQRLEAEAVENNDSNPSFPMVTESQPVPILFGTAHLSGPNVMWYGLLREEVRDEYLRFDAVLVLGFCAGPIDKILSIRANDKVFDDTVHDLSSGPVRFYLDKWDIFGGRISDGGMAGWITLYPGFQDQAADEMLRLYMAGEGGAEIAPAHRGLFTMVFGRFRDDPTLWPSANYDPTIADRYYFGTRPVFKPVSVVGQRLNIRGYGDPQWYAQKVSPNGLDMNPAHIIRELLTDEAWGAGLDSSAIDDDSFMAAADTFHDEALALSFVWQQERTIRDTIQDVLRHANAVLYFEPNDGRYKLKAVRDDYDPESLVVVDTSGVISVDAMRRDTKDSRPTVVDVKYTDRDSGTVKIATGHDQAGALTRGEIREEVQYQLVADAGVAASLATRDILELSAPLVMIEMTVLPSIGESLRPGDVFVLQYPPYGIDSMVMRVSSVTLPDATSDAVVMRCTQDAFAWRDAIYSAPPATAWVDPVVVPQQADSRHFELPLLLFVASLRRQTPWLRIEDVSPDRRGVAAIAPIQPDPSHAGYELWAQPYDGLPRLVDAHGEWARRVDIVGTVSPRLFTNAGVLTETTAMMINPAYEWPEINDLIMFGTSTSKTGQEIMLVVDRYETSGDMYIEVERALFDTPEMYTAIVNPDGVNNPSGVIIGRLVDPDAPVECVRSFGIDVPREPSVISESRVLPYTGRGMLPYEDAPTVQVTIQGRTFAPIAPYVQGISESGSATNITLKHRDRTVDRIVYTSDGHVGPESGVTYSIDVYEMEPNQIPLNVGTITGITADTYAYTHAQEHADRGIAELATKLRFEIKATRDGTDSYFVQSKSYERI